MKIVCGWTTPEQRRERRATMVLIGATVIGLGAGHVEAQTPGATFWVDASGGDDGNDGRSANTALATIQAAADGAQPGDVVNIRAGVYRETVRVPRSGANGAPIIFRAYNGEDVVISGGELLTNRWVIHTPDLWKTEVTWDANNNPENNTLFVNGELAFEARLYAEGDGLNIDTWGQLVRNDLSSNGITSDDLKNLPYPKERWEGAKITFHLNDWTFETRTIATYNKSAGSVVFDRTVGSISAKQTNGFYIHETAAAADKPGEWFKEVARPLLYYATEPGQNPNNLEIELKRRGFGFDVRGRDHIHIEGMTFRGVTVRADANSDDNVYRGNEFFGYGKGPIRDWDRFYITGDRNVFRDNEVHHTYSHAFDVGGFRNQVVNNYFHHIGMARKASVLNVASATELLISHNTVRTVARSFIDGFPLRSEIAYNLFENMGQISWDSGVFDSDGANGNDSFSIFHHNVLRNSQSRGINVAFYGRNNNAVIHHNLIYDFDGNNRPPMIATGNTFRQVYHNTIVSPKPPLGDTSVTGGVGVRYNNNLQISTEEMGSLGVDMRGNHNYSPSDFVNFSGRDFRLAAGSRAIDTGVVIPGINDGYSGRAPDAGALEFGRSMWRFGHDFARPPTVTFAWAPISGTNLYTNGNFSQGIGDWQITAGAPDAADRNSWNSSQNSLTGSFRTKSVELLPGEGMSRTFTGLKPNTNYTVGGAVRVISEVTSGSQFDASSGSVTIGNIRGDDFVTDLNAGEWVRYDNVEFGDRQYDTIELLLTLSSPGLTYENARVQIRLDSPTGPLLLDDDDISVEPSVPTWRQSLRATIGAIDGPHALVVSVSGADSRNIAIGAIRLMAADPTFEDRLQLTVDVGGQTSSARMGYGDWNNEAEPLVFNTGPSNTTAEIFVSNSGGIDAYLDRLYLVEGVVETGVIDKAISDGIVSQSSTGGGPASLAVDRNDRTSTETQNRANSWWQVAFGGVINPGEIYFVNRNDGRANELSNFTVSVWDRRPADGGQKVWERSYFSSGHVGAGRVHIVRGHAVANDGRTRLSSVLGQVVRVQLNGNNNAGNGRLSLASVQVIEAKDVSVPANLARTGIATQSSDLDKTRVIRTAELANDGRVDFGTGTESVTGRENGAWWQVDLNQEARIDQLKIYHARPALQQVRDYRVSVRGADGRELWWANVGNLPANGTITFDGPATGGSGNRLDSVADARVVRLARNGFGLMSLSEVQVWSRDANQRRKPSAPLVVDTGATTYSYDFGTPTSAVVDWLSSDWRQASPETYGDLQWNRPVDARDRGPAPGVNKINQDLVFSSQRTRLSHKIRNGRWHITLNMGDACCVHDNMTVTAEGQVLTNDTDNAPGEFPYVQGTVEVDDGVLNLEFDDAGGTDRNWVLTRMTLTSADR